MSLPPGFLDELRGRLSLGQVVGRKVMWDTRKSNPGKGDLWAPCPFHQEKTASFHVDDRKGYYYCFGCHAKGDAISFVRETENVGFMEAVEILAGEAGLQMPARDPRAQEKADRRTDLTRVMEEALKFYRMQVRTSAGADARAYLEGRGLAQDAQDRWEIGYAPGGWQTLWDALKGRDIADDLILEAGLAKPSTKGGKPYDTFRDRIIFPIRDGRGRLTAYGGRAMDPSDGAKYLNSPETLLFDKGRSLFNHGPAREAAGKDAPLIVAEGYMDVIALSEAGFGAAVAPLGTAITADQLALLWRIAPEPVIALDGDAAGLRAAMRLIDLALPLLEAGRSLRFAILPDRMDPDDLIKAKGPAAMSRLIDDAQPMVQLLWRRETEGQTFDSPERKAALDKALRDRIRLIADPTIRGHYEKEIDSLKWDLFRPRRAGTKGAYRNPPQTARATTKASALGSGAAAGDQLREAAILAVAFQTPAIAADFAAEIEDMGISDPDLVALRDLLMRHLADPAALRAATEGHAGLEKLLARPHIAVIPAVRRSGDEELARMCLAEELAKLAAGRGLAAEIEEAVEDLGLDQADERVTRRLAQSTAAMNRAGRLDGDDKTEYDVGDNGARISRDERAALDNLLTQIDFAKRHGGSN